mmetsp:Transcript_19607/g.78118  ORF Transcript_19607/g.78118 Transcript_19607/m.78118 type:complete len:119 (-) Transcript_19607:1828-2184(-)
MEGFVTLNGGFRRGLRGSRSCSRKGRRVLMLENGHEMVEYMDDDVDRTNGSGEDWPGLIREFEMRAVESGNYTPVSQRTYRETEIDLAPADKDNLEQFKFLKHTESAQMTAMTVSFWW